MIDDAELLRRYAEERSEAAFSELVQRHVDLVYSSALRRLHGDAHGAADVVQQVFTALARQAASLSRHTILPAWLYAATRNVAIDHFRAGQRRRTREQEAHTMHELLSNPGSASEWEQLRPALDAVMDELGQRDREVVLLRFFARRPFAEIGRTLNLSEDAARMRVERALEKLRVRLGRRGITSTAAALTLALGHQAVSAAPAGMAATVTGSALATAGAGAGPVFTLIQFMSTSKIVGGAAGIALVLALGTAVHQVRASREAETVVANARRENDAWRARLRDLQERAAAAQAATDRTRGVLDEERAARAAQRQRALAATADARAAALAEGNAFVARHPEVKRTFLEYRRAQTAGTYAGLFKTLHLTPGQIEQFKDLVAQDTPGALTAPNGETIRFDLGTDRAEAKRQLQALLGEQGYRLYQEFFDAAGPALQKTVEVAAALFDTTAPLTANQGEQLLRILAEGRVAPDWSPRPQYAWAAIIPRARVVLSDAQLDVLARYQAEDELGQAMTRARMAWSQPASNGSTGKPPGK